MLGEAEGSAVRRLQRRRVRQDRREVDQFGGRMVELVEWWGRARAKVGTQSWPTVGENF